MGRLIAARVRLAAVLLTVALVAGTVGYRLIEGFTVIDSLYMTVITLTTVGFGEVRPLSELGRVFTMGLITLGLVAVFDLLTGFTTLVASGVLGKTFERRAMQRRIAGLQGHYVICAYGRVGRAAARELASQGAAVVVIEVDDELEPLLVEAGFPYLIGDPSQEEVLEAAGIKQAKGLLCAVDSDAVNVYITLTARALNPELFIISRASRPDSVDTLRRAGSDRVVSPYALSGARMASLALRPAVLEFVDMVRVSPDLRVEEFVVGGASSLATREVRQVCAPYEGVMLLALRKPGGETLVPPRADTVLEGGDVVIALGPVTSLTALAAEAG